MVNTNRGVLLFNFRQESDGLVLFERSTQPWISVIFTLGFLAATTYSKNVNYIIGWAIVFGLDLLLEWAIIYFFKQDVIRKGKQVLETGSFWKGNKQYKGDISYSNYNKPEANGK